MKSEYGLGEDLHALLSQNLGQFILAQTQTYKDKPAFIRRHPASNSNFSLSGNSNVRETVTFGAFNEHVLKISNFLTRTYGVSQTAETRGFKIGLWGENRIEWCALAIAVWHAGGTLVPLMHIATEPEIKRIIKAARLDALFITDQIIKTHNVETDHLGVENVFLMEFEKEHITPHGKNLITLGALISETTSAQGKNRNQNGNQKPGPILTSENLKPRPTHPDDLAVLIFTSGTTGNPKGVMLTHENLIQNIIDTIPIVPGSPKDRALSVLPLSHMFELIAGFAMVHYKGICISYPDSLKPEDVIREMREHKATMMAAVPLLFEIMDRTIQEKMRALPPTLQKLLKKAGPLVRKYPGLGKIIFKKVHEVFGGHIRYFFTGGAKIDPEVILRFQSLGIIMLQGYGLTETSPIISFTTTDAADKYTSVGKPIKSLQIKIDGPSTNSENQGEGEILVKGPTVFKGYFENEEATKEAFKDGWFQTGDLGKLDEENYIYITGRKKDLIVTPNGKNVYPEELEEILKSSPLFTEVSVIGLESGRGESVHAVIVLAKNGAQDISKTQVWTEINRLTENISEYKKIQGLTISQNELPKTATKKVKKHVVKEMIKKGEFDNAANSAEGQTANIQKAQLDLGSDKQKWLNDKLIEITKRPEIWKEADLKQDLGLDSLTFMEVISQLESHHNIHIPDESFGEIKTVENLVSWLEKEGSSTKAAGACIVPGATSDADSSPRPKTPVTSDSGVTFDFAKNNSFLMNTLRILVHAVFIRPMLKLMFHFKIKNSKKISSSENLVLTPNHTSHFDLLSVLSSLPLKRLKNTYAVAAEDYFFNSRTKAFIVRLLFNAIPFDRKVRIEKGFKICEDILKNGGSLVIFPEGTRSVDGSLARFKPGVGRLLAGHNYKAVPCYIEGAFKAYPKGAALPRPAKISVTFGEPVTFENTSIDTQGYQQVAGTLQKALEELR